MRLPYTVSTAMDLYRHMLWPLMGRMDPERSHRLVLTALDLAQKLPPATAMAAKLYHFSDPRLRVEWRGLSFPNPIGLAAGADKDGTAPAFMEALGFGFVEVGTVTPLPQPGNPRPRVFRLRQRGAMVNSLGFPSRGARYLANRLRQVRRNMPLGINIGKNAATPLGEAAADYRECLDLLYHYGDYFTVNVSSPNTPGLTGLQTKGALASLARDLHERRLALAEASGQPPKPLLVKLSPDLTEAELDDAVDAAVENGVDGIIAVNTSTSPEIRGAIDAPGGISGRPLHGRAVRVVEHIRRHGPADLFIVGVGGVFDADGAWDLLEAGANLVQLYTGLIYRGPGLVRAINRELAARLGTLDLPSIQTLRALP